MAEKKSNAKPKDKSDKKPAEKKPGKKPAEAKAKPAKTETKSVKAEAKPAKTVEAKPEKPAVKAEPKPAAEPQKSKKGWLIGIIVAVVLVVVGAVVAMLCFNKPNSTDPTAKISYSNAFFISDNDKYTIWNAEGKRVTEDEYDYKSDFVGGYAMVKKGDQYGIIREDGKMSVDFGEYGSITAKGGLYLVQDGNTKEYYLITGSGKELAKGSDLTVYTASASSGFAAVKVDGKIKLYNYAGNLVAEVPVNDEAKEPALNSSNDFGIMFYNDQNIVFDARSGEVLAKFDGVRYTFDGVSDSRKMILLEDYDDSNKYKLVANGKVYDLEETKYYGITLLDGVLGYDNFTELALLNDEYKVAKRVSVYIDLKDSNNYAVETENGVEIYRNGEKIKEFEKAGIAASGVLYDDFYAIKSDDKAMFYNLDGSVAINHEYKDIDSLFDQFHHAAVSDDGEIYYLIDTKGNRISEAAGASIVEYDGGYEFENTDGKYAIVNKDGKPVTEFKYESTSYRNNAEPRNIWTGRNSRNDYDVIDVDTGKILLANVNADSFYANHFTVENSDGKTEYYTYDGKLIYTETD